VRRTVDHAHELDLKVDQQQRRGFPAHIRHGSSYPRSREHGAPEDGVASSIASHHDLLSAASAPMEMVKNVFMVHFSVAPAAESWPIPTHYDSRASSVERFCAAGVTMTPAERT
jgi:hypothetical protein